MPEETGMIMSKGRGKTRDMHNHRPSIRSNQGSERELHFITTVQEMGVVVRVFPPEVALGWLGLWRRRGRLIWVSDDLVSVR